MTIRMLLSVGAACLTLSLAGCAQMGPHSWKATNGSAYSPPGQGYSVMLPPGWVSASSNDYADTRLSRHGFDLESIGVRRASNDKAFPALKKGATPDESAEELADDLVAEMKKEAGLVSFVLVTNEPATIGGRKGVHLLVEYSNADGVHYRQEEYAVCTEAGFYELYYRAPVLHFYDLYHSAFATVLQSFQFVPLTSARKS